MEAFTVRDLRERSGDLFPGAQAGQLASMMRTSCPNAPTAFVETPGLRVAACRCAGCVSA